MTSQTFELHRSLITDILDLRELVRTKTDKLLSLLGTQSSDFEGSTTLVVPQQQRQTRLLGRRKSLLDSGVRWNGEDYAAPLDINRSLKPKVFGEKLINGSHSASTGFVRSLSQRTDHSRVIIVDKARNDDGPLNEKEVDEAANEDQLNTIISISQLENLKLPHVPSSPLNELEPAFEETEATSQIISQQSSGLIPSGTPNNGVSSQRLDAESPAVRLSSPSPSLNGVLGRRASIDSSEKDIPSEMKTNYISMKRGRRNISTSVTSGGDKKHPSTNSLSRLTSSIVAPSIASLARSVHSRQHPNLKLLESSDNNLKGSTKSKINIQSNSQESSVQFKNTPSRRPSSFAKQHQQQGDLNERKSFMTPRISLVPSEYKKESWLEKYTMPNAPPVPIPTFTLSRREGHLQPMANSGKSSSDNSVGDVDKDNDPWMSHQRFQNCGIM
ncbi:hypothetical protein BC830DRAFT_1102607 [Chytriomyces sp. MP71]|nr:hypothetical protein BC830DRAFT_1102607 [Chytriomyces sp. MP71]